MVQYFLDRKFPPKSQKDSKSARVAMITCLLTTFFALCYTAISYLIDFEAGMWSQGITAGLFLILCFVFKFTRIPLSVFGNVYAAICFQTIAVLPFYSGGIEERSIILPWFTIIPAVALLLASMRSAWFWFALSSVTIIAYSFIDPSMMSISYARQYEIPFAISVYLGLSLIVMVILATFKRHKEKALSDLSKAKNIVEQQASDLTIAHEELDEQHRLLHSSITYAKNIQSAMLPSHNRIKSLFPESFIIFNPKDVVSGDFYWIKEKNGFVYFAVVDCTGHGVPGAFMSLIGNNILNEALDKGIKETSEILNYLDTGVIACLRQEVTNNHDGMDMVLCRLDKTKHELQFSCAMNPLVYVTNSQENGVQTHRIRGDKHAIGGKVVSADPNAKKEFTNHTLDLHQTTDLYLFSDGFQDQFGSPEDKKYTQKRMRDYFLSRFEDDMNLIGAGLENELDQWKGDKDQIDDILVWGIRFKAN